MSSYPTAHRCAATVIVGPPLRSHRQQSLRLFGTHSTDAWSGFPADPPSHENDHGAASHEKLFGRCAESPRWNGRSRTGSPTTILGGAQIASILSEMVTERVPSRKGRGRRRSLKACRLLLTKPRCAGLGPRWGGNRRRFLGVNSLQPFLRVRNFSRWSHRRGLS